MSRQFRTLAMAAILTSVASAAVAGLISIDPTNGVTASSHYQTRVDDRLVNGSGLSSGLHDALTTTMWLSDNSDTTGFVLFDLGAVYSVTNVHVWNYNELNEADRGVSNVVVTYGTNLTFGYSTSFESTLGEVTNFAKASGAAGEPGETFSSFSAYEAQYIVFDIIDNHGDPTYTGLSEVRFYGTYVRAGDAPPTEITNVTVYSATAHHNNTSTYEPENTLNNTGLNILGHHVVTVGSMYMSANGAGLPEIVYDLGAVYDVESIEVWNYNYPTLTNRGIDGVDIEGSEDNVSFDLIVSTNFTEATGSTTTDFSQLIPITVSARYIKLDVTSDHGAGNYTGLSEIKFYGELPQPQSGGTVFKFR